MLNLMRGDKVLLTTYTMVKDSANALEPVPNPPIEVEGRMQPLNSVERRNSGLTEVNSAYKFYTAPGWTGGIHSAIEWNGRSFIQTGEAMVHRGVSFSYVEVIFTAINAEVQ